MQSDIKNNLWYQNQKPWWHYSGYIALYQLLDLNVYDDVTVMMFVAYLCVNGGICPGKSSFSLAVNCLPMYLNGLIPWPANIVHFTGCVLNNYHALNESWYWRHTRFIGASLWVLMECIHTPQDGSQHSGGEASLDRIYFIWCELIAVVTEMTMKSSQKRW